MVQAVPDRLSPRHLVVRLAQVALMLGVAVALLTTLPGLSDVRTRLADGRPGWIAAAILLELGSVASFVLVFRGVFCVKMGWGFSAQVGLSEQAANVLLPAGGAGGLALGAWALNRAGMSSGHIARRSVAFFLITSSVNFLVAAVIGTALAVGIMPRDASVALAAVPAGLSILTIAAVLALPRVLPDGPPADEAARRPTTRRGRLRLAGRRMAGPVALGVRDAVALVRSGRPSVIVGSIGYLAFDIGALAAAFHAFGGAPQAGDFLMAYIIGQLGGLVPLPGGVGGTDGGLVASLALFGAPLGTATAAVLAYRAFQLGLPAITGTVAFARLRVTLQRDERPAAGCEPLAAPVREARPATPRSVLA